MGRKDKHRPGQSRNNAVFKVVGGFGKAKHGKNKAKEVELKLKKVEQKLRQKMHGNMFPLHICRLPPVLVRRARQLPIWQPSTPNW